MSNYTKLTNFASKDSLASGNPLKVIKGTEIDDEFESIETAIGTKADSASPTFTGTPIAPTAPASTNTTQLATTAMVQAALGQSAIVDTAQLVDDAVTAAKLADDSVGAANIIDNSVGADELNVTGDGTSGQVLTSDGDGSFSWDTLTAITESASSQKLVIGNTMILWGKEEATASTATVTFSTAFSAAPYAFVTRLKPGSTGGSGTDSVLAAISTTGLTISQAIEAGGFTYWMAIGAA